MLIRYPGSKAKLADAIWGFLPWETWGELFSESRRFRYVEPFFGAGAVGLRLIERMRAGSQVWLNDADWGMCALWRAVHEQPIALCREIAKFTPSVDAFYEFKRLDDEPTGDVVIDGFHKLALHRMSVSGFGYMAGGPIGGRSQSGAYNVHCRWTPSRLKKDIGALHEMLRKYCVRITNADFREVLRACETSDIVYCDPPYYEKGPQLYKHSMSDDDHAALEEVLRRTDASWVLSYDDHPRVRELYSWATFHELAVTYTNATHAPAKRPKNREVVIMRQAA